MSTWGKKGMRVSAVKNAANRKPRMTVPVVGAVVALLTLLVFAGALSCGFINLDDPFYVTDNPLIKSFDPAAIGRIFSQAHLGAWLPLTYVSFALDHHFWGDNPLGYHLTNILLHAANAGLVVLLADRLLKNVVKNGHELWMYPFALALAALLWSTHPLRVESVVWVAERKDVLNGLFSLAAVLAYLSYTSRTADGQGGSRLFYLLALVFFMLSLLAKQVSVTLPAILLLLDWYPLGRLQKGRLQSVILEKMPFFAMTILIILATLYFATAQKMLISIRDMPLAVRTVSSGNAIFEYCRFTLVPFGISPYFVLPKPLPPGYLLKTAAVVVITLLVIRFGRRRPAVAVTWCAFLILLSPMLAFLQAGDDIALAARYTYLPAISFSIAAAGILSQLAGKWATSRHRLFMACSGGVVFFLAGNIAISQGLIKAWRDTGTFWSRVIAIEPVGRAYGDRGVFYLINGRSPEALADFDAAIAVAISKEFNSIYNLYAFRGLALNDMGRYGEAVIDFDRAIAIYPHPTYFQLRGEALRALGRVPEADKDFRRAGPNPPAIDWFEKNEAGTAKGREQ